MEFFSSITTTGIAGIVLLVCGALITFLSSKISARMQGPHANFITKCVGLAIVVAGFILIMAF
ncbi:hypothetical protein LJC56_05050 [Christensenellaceae bacterium OttesenSCG-928-K19]|nr:hypothetical protein [Christensenellaceae bacterium OttesenSCG-928-K19]